MRQNLSRRVVTIHDERDAARHARGRVIIIDDDDAIRQAVSALLLLEGYATELHTSALAYLVSIEQAEPVFPGPHCILLDVKMPNLTGLELQRRLTELAHTTPIVFMSGGSGASDAVQAFRSGAVDFLIKPFDESMLLDAIRQALKKSRHEQQDKDQIHDIAARHDSLSEREMQIAKMVSSGMLNRDIAAKLGIAIRTVKLHRMHMMRKLDAANVIELARLLDRLDE